MDNVIDINTTKKLIANADRWPIVIALKAKSDANPESIALRDHWLNKRAAAVEFLRKGA